MPLIALALVLVAALLHATWNLAARRAAARGVSGTRFVWLYSVLGNLVWLGPLLWLLHRDPPRWDAPALLALLATGLLHLGYGLSLQHGYKVSELSVVYPVARGLGPTLSTLGAVVLLDERPSALALLGAGLVVLGILGLSLGERRGEGAVGRGLAWGALTGLLIALYTLNDGNAVRNLGLPALLVDQAGNLLRTLVLAPSALREPEALRATLRASWREALAVAVLGTLGYVLVLTAMTLAPLSHVAPAREISMLLATWLGARVMGEGSGALGRRVAASAVMVAGVVALALG